MSHLDGGELGAEQWLLGNVQLACQHEARPGQHFEGTWSNDAINVLQHIIR